MDNKNTMNQKEWNQEIEFQKETISRLSEKNNVEKVLATDNYKLNNEKKHLLGYLNEDVLYHYDFKQLGLPKTYKEIQKAMTSPDIDKAIINGQLYPEAMERVIELARKNNIAFSIVQDPEFKGEVALILTKK